MLLQPYFAKIKDDLLMYPIVPLDHYVMDGYALHSVIGQQYLPGTAKELYFVG